MVAEMHNFQYDEGRSAASEPTPMYTPTRSHPLSPPSGQSPPTEENQDRISSKGIHPNFYPSVAYSDCPTQSESVRESQIKHSVVQFESYKLQKQSKYSRSMCNFYLGQPNPPRKAISTDELACYEQYYPHLKKPESNAYPCYTENQEKTDGSLLWTASNKTYDELNSYYNSKVSERLTPATYTGANIPSHSLNTGIESCTKNTEKSEKHYTFLLPVTNNSTNQLKISHNESNSSEFKSFKDFDEYADRDSFSFSRSSYFTNLDKNNTTSRSMIEGSLQRVPQSDNERKFNSDHSGVSSMVYNTLQVTENEENYSFKPSREMNNCFKQETYYPHHNTTHSSQDRQNKHQQNELLQNSTQTINISQKEATKFTSLLKSQTSDTTNFTAKNLTKNGGQLPPNPYTIVQLPDIKHLNEKFPNDIWMDNENQKNISEKSPKKTSCKSNKKTYVRGIIFKPYSYKSKDKNPGIEDQFCPKFEDSMFSNQVGDNFCRKSSRLDAESDGGSDGEKASCSTASLCSASPSPSIAGSDVDAPVDLRRSVSDSDDQHVPHVFIPGQNDQQRTCLMWACKACKKSSGNVNKRKAATMRERKRIQILNEAFEALKKVSTRDLEQKPSKVDILKNAIEYIESLEDILHLSTSLGERDCDSVGSDYGAVSSPPYIDEHYQPYAERLNVSSSISTSETSTKNASSLDCLSLIVQNINPETSTLLSAITMDTDVADVES